MGFSHSWIAVRGTTRERALDALGMTMSEIRTDLLQGVALFESAGDWLVFVSDDYRDAIEGPLSELGSLGDAAVACGTNDEALYFAACGYEAGSDIWSVTVKPAKHVFRVVGFPPEQLDPLLARAKAAQAEGVDLFTAIPAALAKSICGFELADDLAAIQHVSLKPTGVKPQKQPVHSASNKAGFLTRLFSRS